MQLPTQCQLASWQNHNLPLSAYMILTFCLSAGATQLARLLANYQHSICDVPFVKHRDSCLPSAEYLQFFPRYAPTPECRSRKSVRTRLNPCVHWYVVPFPIEYTIQKMLKGFGIGDHMGGPCGQNQQFGDTCKIPSQMANF